MSKKKKAYFRVIGDIHQKYQGYIPLTKEAEYSLCVGDIGFDYSYLDKNLDANHHRCVLGNHDNYTKTPCFVSDCGKKTRPICSVCNNKGYYYGNQTKHCLNDYGIHQIPDFEPIFYMRGAWSIDAKYRIPEVSWWEDEEVPYREMLKALDFYKETKPEFVVTHTCPFSIVDDIPFERLFGNVIHKPRTEELLEQMYQEHQPRIWLFGHWHKDWERTFVHPVTGKETTFICLAELSHKDFEKSPRT